MKNISTKLIKIMAECGYVQRQGTNDFHNYKYATAADVLEKINAALVKHGVAATAQPELIDFREVVNQKGNAEHLATVKTTLTLIDVDSGEILEFVGIGSGQDSGDKAVMKAQTASIKYAYLLSLAISTGDDPEADSGVDERTSAAGRPSEQPGARNGFKCSGCGATISHGVNRVSTSKYGRALCLSCQHKARVA